MWISKIISILFVTLLLFPVALTFFEMCRFQVPDNETPHNPPDFPGDMEFDEAAYSIVFSESYYAVSPFRNRFLGFGPRRWVGAVGLAATTLIFGLLVFSALFLLKGNSMTYEWYPDPPADSGFSVVTITSDQGGLPEIPRLSELLAMIQGENLDEAIAAIEMLETECVDEWLPHLHRCLLEPGDFFLREAVAGAIAKLEGIECLPRLLAARHLGVLENHDNDGLTATIIGVVESDKPGAREFLLPGSNSENENERADAAWLLGFLQDQIDPDVMIQLASDPSPEVRSAACGSLSSWKNSPGVFECLVSKLGDSNQSVAISAASALGYFGDQRAIPHLERLRGSTKSERLQSIAQFAIENLRRQ